MTTAVAEPVDDLDALLMADDSATKTAAAGDGLGDDEASAIAATDAGSDDSADDDFFKNVIGDDQADADASVAQATDPDKSNPGAKIEDLNYGLKNLQKQVLALQEQIASQGGNATDRQQQQLQEMKDDLDELGDELGKIESPDMSWTSVKQVSRTVNAVKALRNDLRDMKRDLAAARAELGGVRQVGADVQQRAYWSDWDQRVQPEHRGKGPQLWDKVRALVHEQYPQFTDAQREGVEADRWNQLVTRLAQKPQAAPKPKATPASNRSPKSTQGAQVNTASAPAAVSESDVGGEDDGNYTDAFFKR
jgi:hypothetical protein